MIKDDKNIEVIKLTSNKIKGNIPGENLNGVYSANEFLTRVNFLLDK